MKRYLLGFFFLITMPSFPAQPWREMLTNAGIERARLFFCKKWVQSMPGKSEHLMASNILEFFSIAYVIEARYPHYYQTLPEVVPISIKCFAKAKISGFLIGLVLECLVPQSGSRLRILAELALCSIIPPIDHPAIKQELAENIQDYAQAKPLPSWLLLGHKKDLLDSNRDYLNGYMRQAKLRHSSPPSLKFRRGSCRFHPAI